MDTLIQYDLHTTSLREVNSTLHKPDLAGEIVIDHPDGAHNVAVGVDAPVKVTVNGHVGYYAAGMNQQAEIVINGNAGTGVAENMMSGSVRVSGNASQSAGATAHGGLLVIEGDAAARCGISMKGVDIVVGGSIGHMSAFMAQAADWWCAAMPVRPRRLDLRGAHLRPRRGGLPGRGLRQEGHAPRTPRRARRTTRRRRLFR